MKTYTVYILTNNTNTVLYVGVTNNLQRRIVEHRERSIRGFTAKYGLTKLVYYEVAEDPYAAIAREKQIKGWSRIKKQILVEAENPHWCDLYETLW